MEPNKNKMNKENKIPEIIPGVIQFGPVMKVRDVLAWKQGDPPIQYQQTMVDPSVREVCDEALRILKEGEKAVETKPVFGPERPPAKK